MYRQGGGVFLTAFLLVSLLFSLSSCSGGTSYVGTGGGTSGTSYTVTFKTNGGSAVDSQTVAAGETAKEPEDPKKDGYKFGGWYADSALTSLFSFATKIVKDTTLYAKWIDDSVPTYKVTVNPITNGTVTATPSAGVAEGVEVTLEIKPDPGYALDTLTVDGTNKTADVAAGKYTFKMPASNVTVGAAFKSIYSTGLVGDIVLSDGKYITAENYTKYKSIVDASNETA
ncbi:MAG: InlB B-repeat-containing protein, partial [Treponema sp.]|nr:InlB B-repeat-containing protein [Treponema sp.]